MPPLLTVEDLRLTLPGEGGPIAPVDGVSFSIEPGECIGLVGESGCGKSLTALSLLGLARQLPGARLSGRALFAPPGHPPRDLLALGEGELRRIRGSQIAMVFQDPLSSLNPLLRVDYQIVEVLATHHGMHASAAQARVLELLTLAGVPQPEVRAMQYPHQLSGGLRQRVLLAMALAGEPCLLIADEPTTALDVTLQAQILEELRTLRARRSLAIMFITHDLGVIAQLAARVMVMYAGRIVESAPLDAFFDSPAHPYSHGLLRSLPARAVVNKALYCIPGSPPRPSEYPPGCRFHPRCPYATERCREQYPPEEARDERMVACWEAERVREARGVGA